MTPVLTHEQFKEIAFREVNHDAMLSYLTVEQKLQVAESLAATLENIYNEGVRYGQWSAQNAITQTISNLGQIHTERYTTRADFFKTMDSSKEGEDYFR